MKYTPFEGNMKYYIKKNLKNNTDTKTIVQMWSNASRP